MSAEAFKWVADALVLLGLVAVTVSVVGIIRLPGILMRVHAAGQAVFVGVVIILMGAVGSGQWPLMCRALLVAVFLMLTAPMSAHAIARAAAREQGEAVAEEVDAGQ
ncbi:Na+/H+ antiporter subunit [Cystobacter fuscus]|uniref:Na+/H+ antiporter subunit n=1 Tax=Cystobacter fuscus TaxID=43 RepID=A0A250JL26_9BACT|nr:monovalent cation/H(+) antiporter subunit G [Cystobacter fuscus]ATB44338.1 Na+/H+ antiporter subunit [Cystobacter fuscus]